jgi:hypothetical protein
MMLTLFMLCYTYDDAYRDNSIQALAEYVIYPSACLFIYSLKHDLESVYGTIVVESLVL